jgi:uncharacterized protein YkwD
MNSNPSHARIYDDRREASFLVTAVVLWVLVGLFLVARDPLWRIFYEGQLVSLQRSQNSPAAELDEELVSRLMHVDVSPRPGLNDLEKEFAEAINQRASQEAAQRGATGAPQLVVDKRLQDIARQRAEARSRLYPSGRATAPELLYPELYIALSRPDRFMRVVEASQPIAANSAAGSTVPAELVGGWMNNLSFANIIQNPDVVEVGVGVIPMSQGASVDVLLVQSFAQLDAPLPPVVPKEAPFRLSGRKLTSEEVSFYFKGPKDASFSPLNVQWAGDAFSAAIPWSQGPGTYSLRARRGDRLSDPRPVLVK